MEDFWFSPLKIYEYFSSGLPVVATDRGQISDIVLGDRGTLVQAGDNKGFALAIQSQISDLKKLAEAGQSCRQWVLENSTWKIRARQILDAVEKAK